MIRRRALVATLGGTAAAWPLAGRAQQPKMPTIGILVVGSFGSEAFWRLFQEDLRKLGYVEGRTVRLEYRSDQGEASRLPGLAAELVRLKVDVIVTWLTQAAIAARQATREIPVVMAYVGDPIAAGLVQSLSRPGGNLTGMTGGGGGTAGKNVQFIRDMLPSARRLTALVNASDPFSETFLAGIQQAGAALAMTIDAAMVRNPAELDAAFVALEKDRPDAMVVQPSMVDRRVVQLTLKHRIPTMANAPGFTEEGGLMSYTPDLTEMYRRAALVVDKVLKGAKPADIPVEQAAKFQLAINLKTARALGLAVPPALLAQADEVIE